MSDHKSAMSSSSKHRSDLSTSSPLADHHQDVEQQQCVKGSEKTIPVIKGLGWLDRFLAIWILLVMTVGVLLGNFVEDIGPALQKGKFVGVSIPIGKT